MGHEVCFAAPVRVGDPVRVEMTKWRTLPHWNFAGTFLGSDEYGDWLGLPAGTRFSRPGAAFAAPNDSVTLIPSADLPERGWVAAFHTPGTDWTLPGIATPVEVYVDITTPPRWDGSVVRAVDLDLDIVRAFSGRTWIDDEDEFALHRRTLAYPDVVVAHATINCEQVHHAVLHAIAPYDSTTATHWLSQLAAQ